MTKPYPCGGMSPACLLTVASAIPALEGVHLVSAAEPRAAENPRFAADKLGIPGPFPGRVIEARHPALIKDGVRDREAMKATVCQGLMELTGADDAVEAWAELFELGDVVGIKVVPNGNPLAPTSPDWCSRSSKGSSPPGSRPPTCSSMTVILANSWGPVTTRSCPTA